MPSTLDLTIGSMLIGVLLSTTLWGINHVQMYIYTVKHDSRDHVLLRLFVWLVWASESLHTLLIWAYIYLVAVTFYGQADELLVITWEFSIAVFLNNFIGGLVQSFFAYRVYAVSGGLLVPCISWAVSTVRVGFGIAIAILTQRTRNILVFEARYGWTVTAVLAISAFVDVLNTSALCYNLMVRRTGFHQTNKMIDSLILWTIETGLVTSICAVLELVLARVMPQNYLWLAISLFYAKFYSNSLLVSLNARQKMRNTRNTRNLTPIACGLGGTQGTSRSTVNPSGEVSLNYVAAKKGTYSNSPTVGPDGESTDIEFNHDSLLDVRA